MSLFLESCQNFETYLRKNKPDIKSFHPHFEIAFWEMMLNGGKRFRPNLVLSVVCSYNPAFINNAYDVCLAIECLHTYSLIHDDLPSMDNANLRRGKETLHHKYDEVTAILVGDGLNTYSFYLLSRCKLSSDTKIALIETLSENGGIGGMVLGQGLDCEFENVKLDRNQIDFIHTHKTARLIAASLKMGGIICNLDSKTLDLLYTFGLKLGLFFQIRDDIIDFKQDSKKSGKDSNNDTYKNSYVNLLGINKAQEIMDEYSTSLQNDLDSMESKELKQNLNQLLNKYFEPI